MLVAYTQIAYVIVMYTASTAVACAFSMLWNIGGNESRPTHAFIIAFHHHLLCPHLCREGHYEMMAGVCLFDRLVCHVPRPNSRTERNKKPKISSMETHHMGNPWRGQKFKGQCHQAD